MFKLKRFIMKAKLFLGLMALCSVLTYQAYALSTANEGQEPNGCVGEDIYECQVWQVTPNGAGMILEEGRNGDDVNEDEQEKP